MRSPISVTAVLYARGKQRQQTGLLLPDLLELALARRLVSSPAQEARAVPEALAGGMVVADLHHNPRLQQLPSGQPIRRPPAWPSRRGSGEAGRGDQRLQLSCQRGLVLSTDGRREADMMQEAGVIVQPEQQGSHNTLAFIEAEAADHAVRTAITLDLLHAAPVARAVFHVRSLGDHAIETTAGLLEPVPCFHRPAGGRGQTNARGFATVLAHECFERRTPGRQRLPDQRTAVVIDQ